MSILGILLSGEERIVIRRLPWQYGRGNTHQAPKLMELIENFPLEIPHWNNNDPNDRGTMEELRNLIIKGIRESAPWSQT
jgi:hypothetical protein